MQTGNRNSKGEEGYDRGKTAGDALAAWLDDIHKPAETILLLLLEGSIVERRSLQVDSHCNRFIASYTIADVERKKEGQNWLTTKMMPLLIVHIILAKKSAVVTNHPHYNGQDVQRR
ncbi:hypothetical protein ElyMa_002923600 [Elysia marginata]|uniref:Uncharacterized protein n=1 Tax=Elysia marginata TaxID=1093978 RepID=A0AAV4I379_9GAST|nr:hypothetical protein ElyMa_002923600 [Elysia marginata]